MGAEHKKLEVRGEEELSGRGVSLLRHLRRRVLQGQADDHRRRRRLRDGGGDLPREVRREGHDRAPPRRVPRVEDHARARPRGREHRVEDAVRRRGVPSPASTAASATRRCATSRPARPRSCRWTARSSRSATSRSRRSSRGQVDIDDEGYVIVQGRSTRKTKLPGVFAAGDLVDHTYRQAITAAGLRLPGRARRRVVPARHARGPHARGDAGGRPRRGAVGAAARADDVGGSALLTARRCLSTRGRLAIVARRSCVACVLARLAAARSRAVGAASGGPAGPAGEAHELGQRPLEALGEGVEVGQRVVVGEQAEVHPAVVGHDRDGERAVAGEERHGEDAPRAGGRAT